MPPCTSHSEQKGCPGVPTRWKSGFPDLKRAKLSSDSVTLRVPELIDRSGEITITSPQSQAFDEALRIEGSVTKLGNKGVDIEVRGRDGFVFGPQYTGTKVEFQNRSRSLYSAGNRDAARDI